MNLDQLEKEVGTLGEELDELVWKLRDKKEAYEKARKALTYEKGRRQELKAEFEKLSAEEQKKELSRLKNNLEQMIKERDVDMARAEYVSDPEYKEYVDEQWDGAIRETQEKIKILDSVK